VRKQENATGESVVPCPPDGETMETAIMGIATETNTTARKRSVLRVPTICALAAVGVNLVLWGIGRTAGASFLVDPALGDPNVEVGAVKVIVTTMLPFAVGVLLLALAARRSRRWVIRVGAVGAAFALASAAGPVDGGHDTATGMLLATMHLTTGAAFVVAAMRFGGRQEAPGGARAGSPDRNQHQDEAGGFSDGVGSDRRDAG
jgi:hypothetical protein